MSLLHCSFCGKSQNDVLCLVSGETGNICDECSPLALEIVREWLSGQLFHAFLGDEVAAALKVMKAPPLKQLMQEGGIVHATPYTMFELLQALCNVIRTRLDQLDETARRAAAAEVLKTNIDARTAAATAALEQELAPLRERLASLERGDPLPEKPVRLIKKPSEER